MKCFLYILFLFPVNLNAQAFEELPGSWEEDKPKEQVYGAHPEIPPSYPGGEDSLKAFLDRNLIWPEKDTCHTQKIWVTFTIDTTGQLINIKVPRGGCPSYVQEAIRVFSIMPKWIPGNINGKPTKVNYQFPIRFKKE